MDNSKRVLIEDATTAQLIQFADESLGMKIHPNTGLGKILARIRPVWRPDFITLYNDPAPAEIEVSADSTPGNITVHIRALAGGTSKDDPKIRLIIQETEGAGGQRKVFTSVNNISMELPRGEEFDCPYRYYLALKSSVATLYEQDPDTHEVNGREVAKYPFQVIRWPTPEEMAPWNLQEHLSQYPEGKAPPMERVA